MNDYNCELINIDENFEESVNKAAELYLESGVFVYPTDTIYGFGGNPFNKQVIKRISAIKGRNSEQKFILLIDNLTLILEYITAIPEKNVDFLHKIWPNPVSVILKLNEYLASELGTSTAAFRIPDNRFCKRLLSKLKMPLISTSVNRSGQLPMNDKNQIRYEFGNVVDAIFYTERSATYPASTLIDLTSNEPLLLREGSIKFSELTKYL